MEIISGFIDFLVRLFQLIVAFAPIIFVVVIVCVLAEIAIRHYLD